MKDYIVRIDGLVPDSVKVALKEDLTISSDLSREVNEGAAHYGYYAVLAEKANSRFESLKFAFDLWRAGKEKALIKKQGSFKLVKDLDRMVMEDPKWKAFKLKLADYQEDAKVLKRIADAFDKKVSLIQTANANRRAEYEGSRGK